MNSIELKNENRARALFGPDMRAFFILQAISIMFLVGAGAAGGWEPTPLLFGVNISASAVTVGLLFSFFCRSGFLSQAATMQLGAMIMLCTAAGSLYYWRHPSLTALIFAVLSHGMPDVVLHSLATLRVRCLNHIEQPWLTLSLKVFLLSFIYLISIRCDIISELLTLACQGMLAGKLCHLFHNKADHQKLTLPRWGKRLRLYSVTIGLAEALTYGMFALVYLLVGHESLDTWGGAMMVFTPICFALCCVNNRVEHDSIRWKPKMAQGALIAFIMTSLYICFCLAVTSAPRSPLFGMFAMAVFIFTPYALFLFFDAERKYFTNRPVSEKKVINAVAAISSILLISTALDESFFGRRHGHVPLFFTSFIMLGALNGFLTACTASYKRCFNQKPQRRIFLLRK